MTAEHGVGDDPVRSGQEAGGAVPGSGSGRGRNPIAAAGGRVAATLASTSRVSTRILLASALAMLVGLVLWRLAHDWRALPAEALAAFHLDLGLLALAFGLQTLGWILVGLTWRAILGPEGAGLSLLRHLQIHTLAGLAQVVPGSVWAPLGRLALYRRAGVGALAVSTGLVIELTLLGLAGLMLYGLSAPFVPVLPPGWAPWLGGLALLAAGLLHPRPFGAILGLAWRRFGQGPMPRAPRTGQLARWFAGELGVLGLSGCALWLLMRAISPAASLPWAMGVWGLTVALANLLAWLPATSLLKDGGMVALLTPLYAGVLQEPGSALLVALGLTLAWRIWSLAVLLCWAAGSSVILRLRGEAERERARAAIGPSEAALEVRRG